MKTIQRKSLLYKTGVEYGDYTLNHVQGCAHGCRYPCYAMAMAKRFGTVKTYEDWCEPKLAENAMEILDKEIPKLKGKIDSVQLCFTTDPFMVGYDEVSDMSLKIIRKLNDNDIKCVILTKGILPHELSECSRKNEYGITLVSLDEDFRKQMEPGTAPYRERIQALRELHEAGFYTWVSIEPYPTPNIIQQELEPILQSIDFVDKIIFGRMHYNKKVSAYRGYKEYYNVLVGQVRKFCEENHKACHIKTGTETN